MAKKSNAQYKAEQYARAKETAEKLGIVNRTLPLPASINTLLNELCERHQFTDWRELVINMIRVAHGGTVELVEIPPCGFVPSEQQLRKIGKRQDCMWCGDTGFTPEGDECVECEGVE
jgi:hypothetical protein